MTWKTLWYALPFSSHWMVWNLLLACIPMLLSISLFRWASTRTLVWWLGCFWFLAFLPNAPYVLTDLIHLVEEIQENESLLFNTLVLLPKYTLFVLIGFEAYVVALISLGTYFNRQGLAKSVWLAEFGLHGLSAIGIYLGRFERLNSWYFVTKPAQVLQSVTTSLLTQQSVVFIAVSLGVIAALYWIMKHITLALLLQREYAQALKRLTPCTQAVNKPSL